MVRWIAKKIARAAWNATRPIRRPLRARFDAHVSQLVSDTVNARMMPPLAEALGRSDDRLGRIERALGSANQAAVDIAEEMDLVLGGLSREVFRLQAQVEEIRARLVADRDAPDAAGHFTVVDARQDGDDDAVRRPRTSDRAALVG